MVQCKGGEKWYINGMSHYSTGQLKTLAEFLNTVAAAWFTGGIIAPFFASISLSKYIVFFIVGSFLSYLFVSLAMQLTKEVK